MRGPARGTKHLTGVYGAFGDSTAIVTTVIGGAQYTKPARSIGFVMSNVPRGPRDLIAARVSLTAPGTDRMVVRRGTDYANNAIVPTISFANVSPDAFTPVVGGIVIPNLGTDQGESTVSLITAKVKSGEYFSYSGAQHPDDGFPFLGLPSAQLQAGEFHKATVVAAPASSRGSEYRFIQVMQRRQVFSRSLLDRRSGPRPP